MTLTPLDLEQSAPLRRRQPNSAGGGGGAGDGARPIAPPPSDLPPHHPLVLLKRSAIIGGTVYALWDMKVFEKIIHSPDVSHGSFKMGLASSVAVMMIKGWVELVEGKKRNKKVCYDNFRSATHWTILLIAIAWISFHLSLSPVYGHVKTWLIMVGFGWGVLVQSALMIPVYGQNLISIVLLTVFLQQYK